MNAVEINLLFGFVCGLIVGVMVYKILNDISDIVDVIKRLINK